MSTKLTPQTTEFANSTLPTHDGGIVRFEITRQRFTNGQAVKITAIKFVNEKEVARIGIDSKFFSTDFDELADLWISKRISDFKVTVKLFS